MMKIPRDDDHYHPERIIVWAVALLLMYAFGFGIWLFVKWWFK